jgi:hypothetical protein
MTILDPRGADWCASILQVSKIVPGCGPARLRLSGCALRRSRVSYWWLASRQRRAVLAPDPTTSSACLRV